MIMKRSFYITLTIALLGVNLVSCSKCYDCTSERDYNGISDTVSTELCTANQNEVDQLEDQGYQCAAE